MRESPIRAGAGQDTEPEFGLGESGGGRRDSQVAGQSQLAAAAESGAVDDGDARPGVRLEPVEQAGVDAAQRRGGIPIDHFGDVSAGREDSRSGRVDDQDTGFAAGLQERQVELIDHGLIERVVLVRTIQPDQENIGTALCPYQALCSGGTLDSGGHWSKSTVTVSVTGWDWQVST